MANHHVGSQSPWHSRYDTINLLATVTLFRSVIVKRTGQMRTRLIPLIDIRAWYDLNKVGHCRLHDAYKMDRYL